eukprot:symbB.v1.2.020388.t2/scaffold1706.1/size105289/2
MTRARDLLRWKRLQPDQLCCYFGYCHWQPGELEDAIRRGYFASAFCDPAFLKPPLSTELPISSQLQAELSLGTSLPPEHVQTPQTPPRRAQEAAHCNTPEILSSSERPLPSVKCRVQQLEEAASHCKERPPLPPAALAAGVGRTSVGQTKVANVRHGPHAQDVVAPPPPKAPSRKASPAPRPYRQEHEAFSANASPSRISVASADSYAYGAEEVVHHDARSSVSAGRPSHASEELFVHPAHVEVLPVNQVAEVEAQQEAPVDEESPSGSEVSRSQRSRRSAVFCSSERKVSDPGRSDSSVDMAALESAPSNFTGAANFTGVGLGGAVLASQECSLQERITLKMDHDLSSQESEEGECHLPNEPEEEAERHLPHEIADATPDEVDEEEAEFHAPDEPADAIPDELEKQAHRHLPETADAVPDELDEEKADRHLPEPEDTVLEEQEEQPEVPEEKAESVSDQPLQEEQPEAPEEKAESVPDEPVEEAVHHLPEPAAAVLEEQEEQPEVPEEKAESVSDQPLQEEQPEAPEEKAESVPDQPVEEEQPEAPEEKAESVPDEPVEEAESHLPDEPTAALLEEQEDLPADSKPECAEKEPEPAKLTVTEEVPATPAYQKATPFRWNLNPVEFVPGRAFWEAPVVQPVQSFESEVKQGHEAADHTEAKQEVHDAEADQEAEQEVLHAEADQEAKQEVLDAEADQEAKQEVLDAEADQEAKQEVLDAEADQEVHHADADQEADAAPANTEVTSFPHDEPAKVEDDDLSDCFPPAREEEVEAAQSKSKEDEEAQKAISQRDPPPEAEETVEEQDMSTRGAEVARLNDEVAEFTGSEGDCSKATSSCAEEIFQRNLDVTEAEAEEAPKDVDTSPKMAESSAPLEADERAEPAEPADSSEKKTETNRAVKRAAEATAAASVGVRTRLLRWSRVNSATVRPREEDVDSPPKMDEPSALQADEHAEPAEPADPSEKKDVDTSPKMAESSNAALQADEQAAPAEPADSSEKKDLRTIMEQK